MNELTVFACESQPIVVEGLAKVLSKCDDIRLLGSKSTLTDTLDALREHPSDIVLVDQNAGLKMIFQFIADIKNITTHCQPVLWVNDLGEIDCFRALQVGARGILKKTLPVESVTDCLRSVGRGNVWFENSLPDPSNTQERRVTPRLTPREREIVHHVCAGLKNKEIATALSITAGTVKVHLMHIFEKAGVQDRFELAVHGRRLLGAEYPGQVSRGENPEASSKAGAGA